MINLINGDCLIESDKIESGSVDLILTDLPYGTMKGAEKSNIYGSKDKPKHEWDHVIDTGKIMQLANRILRKNGKMVLFCQQPFTNELINKAISNIPFSYSMIWEKDTFAFALIAKKAPVNYYEDILVFSKTHDHQNLHPLREYFGGVLKFIGLTKKRIVEEIGGRVDHALRVNSTQFSLCTEKTYTELISKFNIKEMDNFKNFQELKEINSVFNSVFNLWEGKKYKSNILKYKKDYTGHHPAQKPVLLLEDLIKTFSNENDLIVDLTMGSGSTGVACKNTNRNFIGIELDESYFNIAEDRVG